MPEGLCRRYVIGLGANLGDRRATLRSAVRMLGRDVLGVSHLYEADPVGPPQPAFLNGALLLESALPPKTLLAQLLGIERAHGRERGERWGPRTLDLDLLHGEGLVMTEPGLTVPHPELLARAFALLPLVDVAPNACDPRTGLPYAERLALLEQATVRRIETSRAWDPRADVDEAPGRTE